MRKPGKGRVFMTLRLSIILCARPLAWQTVYTASRATSISEPDPWVKAKVNALVAAARAAYEKDESLPAYHRVLDGVATSLERKASQDEDFSSRYHSHLQYVETAALDRHSDHLLG